MEGLVFLIAIVALQVGAAWLKKRGDAHRRNQLPPDSSERNEYGADDDDEEYSPEDEDVPSGTPDSLRELIRKFREEQEKRSIDPPEVIRQKKMESPESDEPEVVIKPAEAPKAVPANPYAAYAALSPVAGELTSPIEKDAIAASSIGVDAVPASSVATLPFRRFEFNQKEARRGILWAKVLDDPRFRRRNPVPFNLPGRG